MKKGWSKASILLLLIILMISMASCSDRGDDQNETQENENRTEDVAQLPHSEETEDGDSNHQPAAPSDSNENDLNDADSDSNHSEDKGQGTNANQKQPDENHAVQVVANANDITVLVNKTFRLPEGHQPNDLYEPNVPFIFEEKLEKRLMRKEAALALEQLFAAAEEDGIYLAGVSGYRSHAYQRSLFNTYAQRDGIEAASKYSARPGHSEHETGLAMDVSGSTGKCAAQDCFAGTDEAIWLDENVAEFGFIIRYPEGKEAITGYQYEPWHLRYVGVDIAKEIMDNGLTLEEYFGEAIPVSN